ncbi:MAG: DoxX family protein [Stellaceae bacterium]
MAMTETTGARRREMPIARIGDWLGRILVAQLFILAGISKIIAPQPVLEHMAHHHLPGLLLPLVILLEIGAGVAVLTGWFLRPAAALLAGFCLATAVLVHFDVADHVERAMFFKDLALAGGLLLLATSLRGTPGLRLWPSARDKK